MYDAAGRFALSDVHGLALLVHDALADLGLSPPHAVVERAAFVVHEAMAGDSRAFHTLMHVRQVVEGMDALGVLAAAFHDVVYVQVDRGLHGAAGSMLADVISGPFGSYRLADEGLLDPYVRLVCHVFGLQAGVELSPYAGLNEFASAVVAARILGPTIGLRRVAELSACIEATIPFRGDDALPILAARLSAASVDGLTQAACEDAVKRACKLANQDVAGFAAADPARFLSDTWQLLPESNPELYTPSAYRVGSYRVALHKMEGFLRSLAAERVFHSYMDEPPNHVLGKLRAGAARNIETATRYLSAKLYTISLVEALAEVTGGDGPIDYFMGGLPTPGAMPVLRLEQFLPDAGTLQPDCDPVLHKLLSEGRSEASAFDLPASPATAFFYASFGEAKLMSEMVRVRAYLSGDSTAESFLSSQASVPLLHLCRALSHVAFTRQQGLSAWATRIQNLVSTHDGHAS